MATQNYFKAKNGLEAPSQSTIAVTDSNFPTVRPTLNLDFAGSKSVDSRVTFTRASAATYTGADGKIKYAVQNEPRIEYDPITGECKGLLIEEQRTNLLSHSQSFDNSWWSTKSNANVLPNVAVAPDGSMTADKLIEDTANSSHSIFTVVSVSGSTTYTKSIYMKAAERTWGRLNMFDGTSGAGVNFNLANGTLGTVQPGVTATITPVGNGWYRCTMTSTMASGATGDRFQIATTQDDANVSYAGNGSSGIYIWGAQLEASSFATSYIPSTTTFTSRASSATYFDSTGTLRIAGANQARYGYGYDSTSGKWVSQGLLLESSSTNLYASGNGLLNALSGCTATPNSGYAPDGTYTANRYTSSTNYVYTASQGSIIGGGATHTWSFYVKPVNNTIRFANGGTFGSFTYNLDFSTSTPTATFTATNATNNGYYFVNAGNGWWRFVCTVTASGTPGYMETQWAYTSGTTADFYLWGIQLEAGASASSYIFTSGASVTRAGDVSASSSSTRADEWAKVDLSSFVTKEFTAYAEWNSMGYSNPYPRVFNFSTFLAAIYQASSNTYYVQTNFTPIATVYTPTTLSTNTWNKTTAAYSQTTDLFSAQSNGSTVYNSSAFGNLPLQKTYVYIGSEQGTSGRHLNAWFKGFKLYAKRLSDTQLQAITS